MSVALVMIADDLTGALDSAAPFAAAGLEAAVAVDLDGIPLALSSGKPVIAINTDTRALSQDDACRRVEIAWRAVAPSQPGIVFKKIDSRIKGHAGAESHILARLAGRTRAIVCPAVPENGRLVEQGCLIGDGLAQPLPIAEHFSELGLPAAIPDCAGDAALAPLAAEVAADPDTILPIGARGFAKAIAAERAGKLGRRATAVPDIALPMLMVIGSRDPITRTQLQQLRQVPGAMVVDAPGGAAAPPETAHGLSILCATEGAHRASPAQVADRLAHLAVQFVQRHDVRTILCTGGDTAAAVAHALGIACLLPQGELLPGLPVSIGEGTDGRFVLVTKSGGFGDADTLVRIAIRAGAPAALLS